MEIQASRLGARVARDGSPVLLVDQDRSRWDRAADPPRPRGAAARGGARPRPYGLQAAIAACHARAASAADTDWVRIAALYETLARIAPSPVVELNRAVAIGMAFGPAAGLAHVDALGEPRSTATTSFERPRRPVGELGRAEEARAEFERAASLHGERGRTRPHRPGRGAAGRLHAQRPTHP